MLRLDLRPGEGVDIERGRIVIRVEKKSGQQTRLCIDAAKDIPIQRLEESKATARSAKDGLSRPVIPPESYTGA
jgi:sRNA-binding carbon storage regulator CsrA